MEFGAAAHIKTYTKQTHIKRAMGLITYEHHHQIPKKDEKKKVVKSTVKPITHLAK